MTTPTRTVPAQPAAIAHDRVRAIFDEAADLPVAERDTLVRLRCEGDEVLAAEVRALLAFVDEPAPAIDGVGGTAQPPLTIGRFTVTGKLGQGGMGIVYEATDPTLGRDVALKVVSYAGRDARARMVREAQAMARVAHPNVVPIYEVGEVANASVTASGIFIAMELVRGTTLSAWLRAEPRPWRDVLRCLVDAGRGLAAAHRAGILHRDFKPDNVLVGDDGRARVVDFGLARGAGGATDTVETSDEHGAPLDVALTREGAIVGTPGFMSPEHFEGTLTAAADQWSFAVTAFVALLGRLPYPVGDVRTMREAVSAGPPELPPLGDVPTSVVEIILRALERRPEDRYASLDAMLAELDDILVRDPQSDASRFRRQRRGLAVGVATLGFLNFLLAGSRSDWKFDFGVRGLLVQGLFGFALLVAVGFVFRRALWRTAHDRRVVMMMLLVMGSLSVHRLLVLDGELQVVMRGDAVIAMAILVLGALTIERWLALSAAVMVLYLAISAAIPALTVPAFGMSLIITIALGIWFWREPPLPNLVHAASSRRRAT